MINGKHVLAVIPARGGSKGLPGKNIRAFCGKPLINWTIEQGMACNYIDKVLVSTDSEEIASIAVQAGANAPFLRPLELANDTASSLDVLLHAVDFLQSAGESFHYIVMLEPTSPLRDVSDIEGSLELLVNKVGVESVVGVAKAEGTHPSFLFTVQEGLMSPMLGEQPTGLRRQDLEKDYYYLEGSVYVSSIEALKINKGFYHASTAPWVVDRYKAIEIDEFCDFITAEALMLARIQGVLK